ncbi:hypothetical protein H5410_031169, partial [Solanum commersonii]
VYLDDLSLNKVDFEKYLSSHLPTNLVKKDLTLDKSMLLNLALDALNELLKLAMSDEPFWQFHNISHKVIWYNGLQQSDIGRDMQSQWVEMFPCIIGETKSGTLLLVLRLTQYFDGNYISNFYIVVCTNS